MKKRYFGFVLAALIGGAIAFIAYQRSHNPFVKVLTGSDQSLATTPVAVRMGAVTLSIPRNYFRSYPSYGGRAGVPDSAEFSLWVLWPGLEPFSPTNRAEFERRGFGRSVGVSVRYKIGVLTGRNLFMAHYRAGKDNIEDAMLDYKRFGFMEDNLFRGNIDNPRDFIWCDRRIGPDDGTHFYPSCTRKIKIGENMVAEITYSRDFLPHAQEIERQTIATLNTFRVSGPALEFIE